MDTKVSVINGYDELVWSGDPLEFARWFEAAKDAEIMKSWVFIMRSEDKVSPLDYNGVVKALEVINPMIALVDLIRSKASNLDKE